MMKAVYTILFFVDTLALILFSYFFLKVSGKGLYTISTAGLLLGVVSCIVLLVIVMLQFVKSSGAK